VPELYLGSKLRIIFKGGLLMKSFLLLILVPVLLFALQTGADAGVTAESFSVSPYIGGYSFLGKENLDTRPVYGVRGGYNFTEHFGVEAVADYIRTEGSASGGSDVDAYNLHLDMLYHFLPEGPWVPYFVAGYGWHMRELPGDNDTTRPAFNYGLGLKYFLTEGMALRGDFRHLIMKHNDETFHDLEYTVGVDFLFGQPKPAVAAVQPAPAPEPAPVAETPKEEAPIEPAPAAEPAPGHYKYCITLHGEFDIDRALIRPEYRDEVAKVGDFMKKYPTTTAVIEGHTDNVGNAEHNLELSKKRAEAVVNYLVENYGIDRSRLASRGYGMSRPVADNATDEGRQKNRRMEAIIDCVFEVKEIQPPERLCISLLVEFQTGKSDILPQYRDEIAKVGDYMKRYPTTTAVIEGHTDNVGGYDLNMKLSLERAENVVNYLVQNFGIEHSRLAAKGYGYTRRIAYNNTAEGRAKNRRINAVIDCVIVK
jgi:OmpA-OmpF porin, OOP family